VPALAELQAAIRAVVLGADPGALEGIVADDGIGHAGRLRVYRNNTTILLTEALGDNFPVVRRLVGEEFFAALARPFLRAHPPVSPCLFEYGADFPDFVASFPPAAALPYLADVARLEWTMVRAVHAVDAPVLTTRGLLAALAEDIDRIGLVPHPALGIVVSPYPVDRIWDINQDGADPDAVVDLAEGGVRLAVTRPEATPRIRALSCGGHAVLRALIEGLSVERAARAGEETEAGFDPAAALAGLTADGAFSGFRVADIK
jgi:hypothetical protein